MFDGNVKYQPFLQDLVNKNQFEIFDTPPASVEIKGLTVSNQMNKHPLSYGRLLTLDYQLQNTAEQKTIYLKFRKNYRQVPDRYMEVYKQIRREEQFLPKFYFYSKIENSDESVIAMEYIKGPSLRSLLYSKMWRQRTIELAELFFQNGVKMRLFHDSQQAKGSRSIFALLSSVRERMKISPYFSNSARTNILKHLQTIEKSIDTTVELPLIHIHHDWSLRNIIIEQNKRVKLIDLDAYNRSIDWRWNDFVYFLLNIESQIKYSPFVNLEDLNRLWEEFFRGYFYRGECPQITYNSLYHLFYLIKLDYWTDTYSLERFYNRALGKRYVRRLKASLANGESSIFPYLKLS